MDAPRAQLAAAALVALLTACHSHAARSAPPRRPTLAPDLAVPSAPAPPTAPVTVHEAAAPPPPSVAATATAALTQQAPSGALAAGAAAAEPAQTSADDTERVFADLPDVFDESATPAMLAALSRGVAMIRTDRPRALQDLASSEAGAARPWVVYLEWLSGNRAQAARHLEALRSAGVEFPRAGRRHDLTDVLRAIGHAVEIFGREAQLTDEVVEQILPCRLYDDHPDEALEAFNADGTSRNSVIAWWKDQCFETLLHAALTPERERATRAALEELTGAPYRVYDYFSHDPPGEEGSLSRDVGYEVFWNIAEPILAAGSSRRLHSRVPLLQQLIGRAAHADPGVRQRLGAFNQTVARTVDVLAEAQVTIAAQRHHPRSLAECREALTAAAQTMLAQYLWWNFARD